MQARSEVRRADLAGSGRAAGGSDRPAEHQDSSGQARLGSDEEKAGKAVTMRLLPSVTELPSLPKPDTAGRFCKNRFVEWTMAMAFLLLGLQTAVWPDSIERSAFALILNVLSPTVIGCISLFAGVARIAALYMNGRLPYYGPMIRAIGAGVGFCVMVSMAFALGLQTINVDRPPSPGVPFYLAWAFAEWLSAVRAASDVRYRSV